LPDAKQFSGAEGHLSFSTVIGDDEGVLPSAAAKARRLCPHFPSRPHGWPCSSAWRSPWVRRDVGAVSDGSRSPTPSLSLAFAFVITCRWRCRGLRGRNHRRERIARACATIRPQSPRPTLMLNAGTGEGGSQVYRGRAKRCLLARLATRQEFGTQVCRIRHARYCALVRSKPKRGSPRYRSVTNLDQFKA